jgi:hypothetical protein
LIAFWSIFYCKQTRGNGYNVCKETDTGSQNHNKMQRQQGCQIFLDPNIPNWEKYDK